MSLLPVTGNEIATGIFILIAILVLVVGVLLFVLGRRKAKKAAEEAEAEDTADAQTDDIE